MYVDFSIQVNQKLPQRILDDIAKLDEYYKNEDDLNYLLLEESVNSDLRNCCECGILDSVEFREMYRRFGW